MNAIARLDAARTALVQAAQAVPPALGPVLATIYPTASCIALITDPFALGPVRLGRVLDDRGIEILQFDRHLQPVRPTHLLGNWPLSRLPRRAARPHLGALADSTTRTINSLLTEARIAGAEFDQHRDCGARLLRRGELHIRLI